MADPFFRPVSGFDLPRFAGIATFMRLPRWWSFLMARMR